MLPEIHRKSHLSLSYFDFNATKAPHNKLIHSHPYNYEASVICSTFIYLVACCTLTKGIFFQVQLLLPNEKVNTLKNAISSCDMHYYELEAPLAFILDPDFLKEFVTTRE
jgi:hypothetical protein